HPRPSLLPFPTRRSSDLIRNCHLPIVAADLRSDRVRVVSSSFVGRAAVLVTAFCDSFLSGRLCGNVVAESFIERRSNNKEEHEYADNRTNDRNDQRGNRKHLSPLEEKGDNGQDKRDRKKNPTGNQCTGNTSEYNSENSHRKSNDSHDVLLTFTGGCAATGF